MVSISCLTLVAEKVKRRDGRRYYNLPDDRIAGDNAVKNYVGSFRKQSESKTEIMFGDMFLYITRLTRFR
ncbi:MAG: hypothetical protein M1526_07095 [Candidatus Thermoplasmatota archaeon]|nr:hypothetical protein [Candidatus Thermoplasmatota archaeon]